MSLVLLHPGDLELAQWIWIFFILLVAPIIVICVVIVMLIRHFNKQKRERK